MKASQTGGKYTFSSSGLVIISETLKLILSASLLLRQCWKKSRQSSEESGPGYAPLIPLTSSPRSDSPDELIGLKGDGEEEKSSEETLREDVELALHRLPRKQNIFFLWVGALMEVSVETRYGFANLALLYSLINNTVGLLFPTLRWMMLI